MTYKRLQVASVTHRGLKRQGNEDCLVVGPMVTQEMTSDVSVQTLEIDRPVLCMVADGMGGHASGEVASRFVSERLAERAPSLPPDCEAVAEAIEAVNLELTVHMGTDEELLGMGTTVAGLLFYPDGALCFNVGDSSVYRVQGRFLAKLSIDDVSIFGVKGALTQALGGSEEHDPVEPHVRFEREHGGRCYLICSDGLTDMVSLDDMEACLSDDPAEIVSKLLKAALDGGGLDNISILAIKSEE